MLPLKLYKTTDNFVFTLYYRWTVLLLLSFSFIVTCKLMLGFSFTCTTQEIRGLSPTFVDHYCYSNGTFIDLTNWHISRGRAIPYRGIGPSTYYSSRWHIGYYDWVNLILLLHAFNFYLPHLIWKIYEKGFLFGLTAKMDLYMKEDETALSLCVLAKYLVMMEGRQTLYVCLYICCEFLNHLIALLQLIWLVSFFQVTGVPDRHPDVVLETWSQFCAFYFPLVSQCLLYVTGNSGVVTVDAHCSLPLNSLYKYIFLFLYVWYILLAVMSGVVLIYRLALLAPQIRMKVIMGRNTTADPQIIRSICSRSSFCDWFILSRVQKNLLPNHFAELVRKLGIVSQCCEEMDNCDKLITTSFSSGM